MPARRGSARYSIRQAFDAPVDFVFRWCTDYTPEDPRLGKEVKERRILERSEGKVVYEDLEPTPGGWHWSRVDVTLHPPDRWTARIRGNHRDWRLEYTLRSLPGNRSELFWTGVRRPALLGTENPSRRSLEREMHQLWGNYARVLERDYRRKDRRGSPRRR